MFDEVQLRDISSSDLARLGQRLAALSTPRRTPPLPRRTAAYERRRTIVLVAILVCCVILAAWTGLLAATLPHYYRSGGWRGAWVGFDIALLAAFSVTGWAAWRRRHILIMCLVVLATLLCCDAWFDVVLDAHTSGFWLSLMSALLIELPLAAVAITGARRLLRLTIVAIGRRDGYRGPVLPLWQVPLLGESTDGHLRDLLPRSGRTSAAARALHTWLPGSAGGVPEAPGSAGGVPEAPGSADGISDDGVSDAPALPDGISDDGVHDVPGLADGVPDYGASETRGAARVL